MIRIFEKELSMKIFAQPVDNSFAFKREYDEKTNKTKLISIGTPEVNVTVDGDMYIIGQTSIMSKFFIPEVAAIVGKAFESFDWGITVLPHPKSYLILASKEELEKHIEKKTPQV